MVFLPGGKKIALRSNTTAYILDASSYETVASAELPTQSKGNSLAVSLDGKYLLLGTQGPNAKVYSIPVPAKVTPSPSRRPPTARATSPKQLARAGGELSSRSAWQPSWRSWRASWPESSATADRSAGVQVFDHPVNAPAQLGDVLRLDVWEHPNS